MKRIIALTALLSIAAAAASATAAPRTPATQPAVRRGPTAHAVIITGLGGNEAYSRNLLDWANRFHAVLTGKCGVPAGNVLVLTETAAPKGNPPRRKATLENIRAAMDEMARKVRPDDQFILFLAGHGQIQELVGKLCLPGLDLRSDDLEDMLSALKTEKMVIVNCASGGADFLKDYLKEGRVILTAAGYETEGTQTYFAEFFIRAYETGKADTFAPRDSRVYGNKDGKIDMLEAFCYAAKWTADWYHRQYLLTDAKRRKRPKEGEPPDPNIYWLVRGKVTRQVWKRLYEGSNYKLTRPEFKPKRDRKTGKIINEDPLPKDLDAEPDFEPKFGRFDENWHNRRILAETARLDDNGIAKEGFFLWKPYKFQKYPKRIHEGDATYLARRTVLGAPKLLKAPD